MTTLSGGIGARLRAGRERLGLSLLQVAEKLHVDPKTLESLETENFEALGAAVYARGHLRHYAEFVGESADELGQMYSSSSRTGLPDLTRLPKAPPPSESNKLVAPALLVLAVFAVAGAIWWVLSLQAKPPAHPTPLGQTVSTPAPANGSGANDRGATGRTAPPVRPAASPERRSELLIPPQGAHLAAAEPVASPEPTPPPPPRPRPSLVTLHYAADSWTEVYDASGARLLSAVGAADTERIVNGVPPLRIVVGSAAGVSVLVNGHVTPVGQWAGADGSTQFVVTRSGRVVRGRASGGG
jgi:cytoskeleton protein RodZ